MKRIIYCALLLIVGTFAGYGVSASPSLFAQRVDGSAGSLASRIAGVSVVKFFPWDVEVPAVVRTPIPAPQQLGSRDRWPNQHKETTYWAIEDIRKAHQLLAEAEKSGERMDPNSALHDFPYWSRTHSMFIEHVSQKGTENAAQQHLGYAQFIVVMGGSGKVIAGGQIEKAVTLTDGGRQISGELRGQRIVGGEEFQVAENDLVSIPPDTPSQFSADASGGLTYMVVKVNAMMYPWDMIR